MAPPVAAAARPGTGTEASAPITADTALAEIRKSFVRPSKLARIRGRCLNCVDGQAEVRACAFFSCPLWPFRMAKNPWPSQRGFAAHHPKRERAGAGVSLETLRAWAGRAQPMDSVPSPDPRAMTVAELEALGLRPGVARALRQHDAEGCGGLEDDGRVQEAENARLTVGMDAALAGAAGDLPAEPARARPPLTQRLPGKMPGAG